MTIAGSGTRVNFKGQGTSYARLLETSANTADYPTIVNTTTRPTQVPATSGIIPVGQYSDLVLCPFGTGDDDSTFAFKVVGWSQVVTGKGAGTPVIWKPTTIFRATATLSTSVGVSGATQTNLERDADTIVAGSPVISTSLYTIYSPADNTPGFVVLSVLDFELIGVYFDLTGATGANMNYRWNQG
jgi:hypothetical protein